MFINTLRRGFVHFRAQVLNTEQCRDVALDAACSITLGPVPHLHQENDYIRRFVRTEHGLDKAENIVALGQVALRPRSDQGPKAAWPPSWRQSINFNHKNHTKRPL